jgi:hypothetical protein
MKVTQAVNAFLKFKLDQHPGRELVERYLAFGGAASMETQTNVAAGRGEPVHGKRATWTDGTNEWFNFRIPRKANTVPEFRDYELRYPLEEHAEAIGWTGWDWPNGRSRCAAFDFDHITCHAAGVGVTEKELAEIAEAASALPYVEVRRSTGGKGLHLYVYFDGEGIPTANHTEHAALARCVLGMMSSETGFDFASQIDCCGGVMWIWARKMTMENHGLELTKAASKRLGVADLPLNWKDHIEVVSRRRTKIRVQGVADTDLGPFEAMASARTLIPLDATHKAILEKLTGSGYSTIWVPDHHLVQTHTKALATLYAQKDLKLRGFFSTISEGHDPGTPNCFLFPLPDGAFKVYRFSPGISEADSWEQDGSGWTTCYFNTTPDLSMAARAAGGVRDPDSNIFHFATAEKALEAVAALGQKVKVTDELLNRPTRLRLSKDGQLVVEIQKDPNARREETPEGFVEKKGYWVRGITAQAVRKNDELDFTEFDNLLRLLKTPANDQAGWIAKQQTGEWVRQPTGNVRMWLQSLGHSKAEAEVIMGAAVNRAWTIVNLPFHVEYPGARQWNLDAAQFRYQPAELGDDEVPHHPHWDMVLNHIGQDLTPTLRELAWAQDANFRQGGDYLRGWIASMFRDPFEPLPFLFMYGPENSGKSIFHEAIALLVTKGIVPADRALTNANDFNGELANAIMCVVEEKNVSLSPGAHAKIKEWVTSRTLSVRKMRMDSYTQPNTTHWVQCANKQENCPVFPGDTRITVIYVPVPAKDIPKKMLMERLREESPHFMYTLMKMELPAVEGRLRLPVVATSRKQESEELSRDALECFLGENCFYVPGVVMTFSEFYERFTKWLEIADRNKWSRQKVSRSMPVQFPIGTGRDNKTFIGNLSWESAEVASSTPALIRVNGTLKLESK